MYSYITFRFSSACASLSFSFSFSCAGCWLPLPMPRYSQSVRVAIPNAVCCTVYIYKYTKGTSASSLPACDLRPRGRGAARRGSVARVALRCVVCHFSVSHNLETAAASRLEARGPSLICWCAGIVHTHPHLHFLLVPLLSSPLGSPLISSHLISASASVSASARSLSLSGIFILHILLHHYSIRSDPIQSHRIASHPIVLLY